MATAELNHEITMEMLSDLRAAIDNVVRTVFPSVPMEVELVTSPYVGLRVKALAADAAIYPSIVRAKAVVRPTDTYRRLLGLPTLGD